MRRNKWLIGAFSTACVLVGFQVGANAEEAKTDVTIRITEPELYIESVTPPKFTTYEFAKDSHVVKSESDLAIKVIDKRESRGAWKLNYHLSFFEKEEGKSLGTFHLSKGKLLSDDKAYDSTFYEAIALDNKNEENGGTIVTVKDSNTSSYDYVVNKDDISLDIPAQAEIGKYYSTEVVTLESVPTYE